MDSYSYYSYRHYTSSEARRQGTSRVSAWEEAIRAALGGITRTPYFVWRPRNQIRAHAGLAVHLAFDEGKGSLTRDAARKKPCKIMNAAWTDGRLGRALELSGEQSAVRIEPLSLADTDYTLMALYIDGRLVALDTTATEPSKYLATLVGASGDGSTKDPSDLIGCFKGAIDEVRIYTRELSYREVLDHAQRR